MKNYLNRIVDKILEERLKIFGAVNVVGPKWCGKTETSKQHANDLLKVDDYDEETIKNINVSPLSYLPDKQPVLIDEWQLAPHIWDVVRNLIDQNKKTGAYILTGSTSTKPHTQHTGTGRINDLVMYPMSLYESNESNGKVSLIDLFNNKFKGEYKSNLKGLDIIFAACRGGWPWAVSLNNKSAQLEVAKSYYKDIYTKDILNIKDPKTKSIIMERVLLSYARNISTYAENSTIYNDVGIDKDTLSTYLDILKRLYIVEELSPWSFSARSKYAIRSQKKREFVDPSIAVSALKLTPEKLLKNMKTFGFIFETLCIRDLRVYSSSLSGELFYFKLKNDLECDCVLELNDGRYALIEIKFGPSDIATGIKNLNKIEQSIIKTNLEIEDERLKQPLPTFKMVLTGTDLAYKDETSNVYVVPIGCLKD